MEVSPNLPPLDPNAPPFQQPPSTCSWSKKLSGLRHIPELQRLKYSPPLCKEDRVFAICSKDEVARTEIVWKEAIHGFFADKKPFFPVMVSAMEKSWKIKEKMEVFQRQDDSIIIVFSSREERNRVLESGPWFILGRYLHLRPWSRSVRTRKDFFASMPIWIRLPNLPLQFWSPDSIGKIASGIGKPLYLDESSASVNKIRFARVCVEISADKSPPRSVVIEVEGVEEEQVFQPIEYETIFKMCGSCNSFGHTEGECDKVGILASTLSFKNVKKFRDPARNNSGKDPKPNSTELLEEDSSGWIQVKGKRRNRNKGFNPPSNHVVISDNLQTVEEEVQLVAQTLPLNRPYTGSPNQKTSSDDPGDSTLSGNRNGRPVIVLGSAADISADCGAQDHDKAEDNQLEVVAGSCNPEHTADFPASEIQPPATALHDGPLQAMSEFHSAESDRTEQVDPKDRVDEPALFSHSLSAVFSGHQLIEPGTPCGGSVNISGSSSLLASQHFFGPVHESGIEAGGSLLCAVNSIGGPLADQDAVLQQILDYPPLKHGSIYTHSTQPSCTSKPPQAHPLSDQNSSPPIIYPNQGPLPNLTPSHINQNPTQTIISPSHPIPIHPIVPNSSTANPKLSPNLPPFETIQEPTQSVLSPKPSIPSQSIQSTDTFSPTPAEPISSPCPLQITPTPTPTQAQTPVTKINLRSPSPGCDHSSLMFPPGFSPKTSEIPLYRIVLKGSASKVPEVSRKGFLEDVDQAQDEEIFEVIRDSLSPKVADPIASDTNYVTHQNVRRSPRMRRITTHLVDMLNPKNYEPLAPNSKGRKKGSQQSRKESLGCR